MDNTRIEAVIFDLDDTLVDTSKLQEFRENKDKQGLIDNIKYSKVYKPVPKMLAEIKRKNVPLALVTNSPKWYATAILDYHSINIFDVVICYDDVRYSGIKPSPEGMLMAISQLGLNDKSSTIYIGDLDTDFIAAYFANIKPVAPSWATRLPIDQVPAAIINSETLISCLDNYEEIALIADRTASNKTFNFLKRQLNFIPLNEHGQVAPLNKEDIKLIALGRYFSQGSSLTATYHATHQLSLDIYAKETSATYVVPQYYVNLIAKVVQSLSLYVFDSDKKFFDIVTVIPAKQNKNKRLENLLKRVSVISESKSDFLPDIFEFNSNAVSLKTLGAYNSRINELSSNFHLKHKYQGMLKGKRILVIDDVITTGATFSRAFELLDIEQTEQSMGICLAKTVSIKEEHKFCPECNRLMKIKSNSTSGIHFYGCTGFYERPNQCKHTEDVKIKDCPRCDDYVIKKYNPVKKSIFLTCKSFGTPNPCNYTENMEQI